MNDSSNTRQAIQRIGQSFGEYTFYHILAEGGMGIILEAEHKVIRRKVALKIVSPKYAARNGYSPELVDTFMHEARVLGAIDHPNVITLYDAGQVGQCPYMAMRLVGGGDLGTRVANYGPLGDELALRIMRDCAAGLHAVHLAGFVNRDIKPANILLEASGIPRLTDFGLAMPRGELPKSTAIAGTPAYLAPEQITGGQLDERTDIYALGATMFYAITGQPPFAGSTPEDTIQLVRDATKQPTARYLRPNVNKHLATIVRRAMAREPDKRYKDASEIEHDCRSVLDGNEPEYANIGAKKRKTFFGSIMSRARAVM
jgi:eukaryotic-like serine/threonine-protein kinase